MTAQYLKKLGQTHRELLQEKRETEKNMEVMWAALRKHPDGVGFLELVMNTQSFAQLCENCFTLSFLVSCQTCVYMLPLLVVSPAYTSFVLASDSCNWSLEFSILNQILIQKLESKMMQDCNDIASQASMGNLRCT